MGFNEIVMKRNRSLGKMKYFHDEMYNLDDSVYKPKQKQSDLKVEPDWVKQKPLSPRETHHKNKKKKIKVSFF